MNWKREYYLKNIANPDFQVELLNTEMGYSTRQFYRKLKQITERSPADITKEYRLTMAERLLVINNLTIKEIMDQTGFNNRGTFYKLFSKHYGMPPRKYKEQQKENVKKGKISKPGRYLRMDYEREAITSPSQSSLYRSTYSAPPAA